ncbi:MAG: DUF423 domain-containing protein [Verrucomicrobiota bacterium]
MDKRSYTPELRLFFRLGVIFALSAVALGAFGAHALNERLLSRNTVDVWETAVDYQMWHALALILFSWIDQNDHIKPWTCYAFTAGILLFSGSLYWLALGGPRWLGPVTPLGGLALMIGWLIALLIYSRPNKSKN